VLHLYCWICLSSNVGYAWLSDCLGRLSPNLWCLFYALSIEMCFIAVYLQRKHDMTWHWFSCQVFLCGGMRVSSPWTTRNTALSNESYMSLWTLACRRQNFALRAPVVCMFFLSRTPSLIASGSDVPSQARRQVSIFGGAQYIFRGQDFCFYCVFKTFFSGCNKMWGALPPHAPPWLRACT